MAATHFLRTLKQIPLLGRLGTAWRAWHPILPDVIVSQYQGAGFHIFDPEIPASVLDQARRDMDAHAGRQFPDNVDSPWVNGWPHSRAIRTIALAPKIRRMLRQIYGRQTFPYHTMNHRVGSELPLHRDSIHWSTDPPGFMCGVWVALEDMDEFNGTLVYHPYSHKLPTVRTEDFSPETGLKYYPRYEELIQTMIDRSGLRPEYAYIPKGMAVMWASDLIHGGMPRIDRSRTRYSQVTHYSFEGCQYYFPLESYGAHRHLMKPSRVR